MNTKINVGEIPVSKVVQLTLVLLAFCFIGYWVFFYTPKWERVVPVSIVRGSSECIKQQLAAHTTGLPDYYQFDSARNWCDHVAPIRKVEGLG